MDTFEFAISPKVVDGNGKATVPSICRYIANAVARSASESDNSLMMSHSAFVIDERPKQGEILNILVSNPINNNVTPLNKNVTLTDSEGVEIGHGTIEWNPVAFDSNSPEFETAGEATSRFLGKFMELLPSSFASTCLQTGIEVRLHRPVRKNDNLTYKIRRARDDRFVFQALSGSETIFRASLLTA